MNAHVSDFEFIGLHPEMTWDDMRYLSTLALAYKKDDHPIFLDLAEKSALIDPKRFIEENDDGELENIYSLVNEYDVYIDRIIRIMSNISPPGKDTSLRDYIKWAKYLEPEHRARLAHLLFLMNEHAVNNPDWKST